MENKKLKPSFSLFITIVLITVLFLLSLSIIENNLFQSNLNKLKYMNLQASIHYDYVKEYINKHSDEEIKKLLLDDKRFNLDIKSIIENGATTYYIIIEANGEIPIRLSKKIIK